MIRRLIQKTRAVPRAFAASMLANAAIGAADIVVGFFFLVGGIELLLALTPKTAAHIAETGAFYFFSHGVVKLLLSWNLLEGKRWAYPSAEAFFAAFGIYQIIDLLHEFSFFVLALFVVNAAVLIMVIREHKRIARYKP